MMSSALRKVIEDTKVTDLWTAVCEIRKQSHTGFIPAPGEQPGFDEWGRPFAEHGSYSEKEEDEVDRRMSKHFLPPAIEKLRQAMFEVGKACALDPLLRAKSVASDEALYHMFVYIDLDTRLLKEPDAKEAFLEGFQEGLNV